MPRPAPRILALVLLATLSCGARAADPATPETARGRYLTLIAGRNACHTEGFAPSAGKVPEAQWLTGSVLGMPGPWGTTYPANLRLLMQAINVDQWLAMVRTVEMRPPMPWFDLREMSEPDLRALYAFVRSLGPAGVPAPTPAEP